ncbi:hypothetical protein GIB67_042227 [Kingdonia uniflora]|uniref:Transcription factor CBF/NF-Y/archaeal histone domain-containing protein n=1 Tax=Kingdonia uniflora TaxID=39325 RepID=A0A7J7LE68_9MAGN|nr:hypothetical protein GIB67_042227 [Kingdonia uniflora]
MEHAEGNNGGKKLLSMASANAGVVAGVQPQTVNVEATAENVHGGRGVKDPYMCMPVTNVIRIMRMVLPNDAKISDDSKETVQECVFQFIRLVTQLANEHCLCEQRKTVIADDLIWAMGKLGFEQYVAPLSYFLHRYRESESDRGTVRARRDPMMGRIMSPVMGPPQGPFGNGPFMPQFHMGMNSMMGQQQPPPPPAIYGGPTEPYFMDGVQFNMSPNVNPNQPMNNSQTPYPMNMNPDQNLNPTQFTARGNNPYGP